MIAVGQWITVDERLSDIQSTLMLVLMQIVPLYTDMAVFDDYESNALALLPISGRGWTKGCDQLMDEPKPISSFSLTKVHLQRSVPIQVALRFRQYEIDHAHLRS